SASRPVTNRIRGRSVFWGWFGIRVANLSRSGDRLVATSISECMRGPGTNGRSATESLRRLRRTDRSQTRPCDVAPQVSQWPDEAFDVIEGPEQTGPGSDLVPIEAATHHSPGRPTDAAPWQLGRASTTLYRGNARC